MVYNYYLVYLFSYKFTKLQNNLKTISKKKKKKRKKK